MSLVSSISVDIVESEVFEPTLKTHGILNKDTHSALHCYCKRTSVTDTNLSMFFASCASAVPDISNDSMCWCLSRSGEPSETARSPAFVRRVDCSFILLEDQKPIKSGYSQKWQLYFTTMQFFLQPNVKMGSVSIKNTTSGWEEFFFFFNDILKSRDDFKGIIFHSSCTDCLMMSFQIKSPTYNIQTVTLYSGNKKGGQRAAVWVLRFGGVPEFTQACFDGAHRKTLHSSERLLQLNIERGTENLWISIIHNLSKFKTIF